MRFRATLAPEQVAHLYALVSPLAKVASHSQAAYHGASTQKSAMSQLSSWTSNTCLLALDSERMYFALDLPPTEGMSCVAIVEAKGGIFLEHRIESNAPDNRIILRVDLVQFRTALQSIHQQIQTKSRHSNRGASAQFASAPSTLTVLKLAKRQGMPCLCLEAKTAFRMEMHQTIPVQVQRPSDWSEGRFGLPNLPAEPTVQLWLPPTSSATLKSLLDAVKQPTKGGRQATHILFTGHGDTSELRLQLQHDNGAQLQTLFLGQAPDGQQPSSSAATATATVRVNAAHVACTLNHGAWTTEWSWIPNQALVVAVRLAPVGICTYVLPVSYLEEDDQEEEDDDDQATMTPINASFVSPGS